MFNVRKTTLKQLYCASGKDMFSLTGTTSSVSHVPESSGGEGWPRDLEDGSGNVQLEMDWL